MKKWHRSIDRDRSIDRSRSFFKNGRAMIDNQTNFWSKPVHACFSQLLTTFFNVSDKSLQIVQLLNFSLINHLIIYIFSLLLVNYQIVLSFRPTRWLKIAYGKLNMVSFYHLKIAQLTQNQNLNKQRSKYK
jgi:hypothetical protein